MLLHEFEQLPDLVSLRPAADALQIHQLRHTFAGENVVAAIRAHMAETKRFRQLQCLGEAQIPRTLQSLPQELLRIHKRDAAT